MDAMKTGAGMDLLETVNILTAKALSGQKPTRDKVLTVLRSGNDDLMDVIAAAFGFDGTTSGSA